MKVDLLLSVVFLTLTCPFGTKDTLAPTIFTLTNFVQFLDEDFNSSIIFVVASDFGNIFNLVRLMMECITLIPNFTGIPTDELLFWEQVKLRCRRKETARVLFLVPFTKGEFTNRNLETHSNRLLTILHNVFESGTELFTL